MRSSSSVPATRFLPKKTTQMPAVRISRRRAAALAVALSCFGASQVDAGATQTTTPREAGSVTPTVSKTPTVSADGRFVAYAGAPMASDDTRASTTWLLDRLDGSVRELTPLVQGIRPGSTLWPVISADGCTVTVITEMSLDLFRDDDEGARWDVYRTVLPQCGGEGDWELVSATAGSGFDASAGDDVSPLYPPAVSGEGSIIAYTHRFSALAPDVSGIAVANLTIPLGDAGRVTPVAGTPAEAPDGTFRYRGLREPAISADGNVIAFASDAASSAPTPTWGSGRQPGGFANSDVYVWDRSTMSLAVRRVSVPSATVDGDSYQPAVSGDGSTVAFVSTLSSLVPGATLPPCTTSCVPQVYLVDLATGALRLGSRVPGDPAAAPVAADAPATQPSLDLGGDQLVYVSRATNLFPSRSSAAGGPGDGDIVLSVPSTGTVMRVSSSADGTTPAPAANSSPRLSASGRVVVFDTLAGAMFGGQPVAGRQIAVVTQKPTLHLADLDMGTVAVTYPGPEWFLVVNNEGPSAFMPATVTVDEPDFLISGGTCVQEPIAPVPPGGSCTVTLMFMPSRPGTQSATLTVAEEGYDAVSLSSELSGFGGDPTLAPSPAGADSKPTVVGGRAEPMAFTVYNVAFNPVRIASVRIEGPDGFDFQVIDDQCSKKSIDAAGSCQVSVVFAPIAAGRRTASVVVTSADGSYTTMLVSGDAYYEPKLAAGSTVVPAGSRVTVIGAGFAPGVGVNVGWADGLGQSVPTITDASGMFSVDLVVRPGDRPGTRTIVAQAMGQPTQQVAVTDVVVVSPQQGRGPASPAWPGH